MRKIIAIAVAAALLTVCLPARAEDRIVRSGDSFVRISDGPCMHAGTLARIPPLARDQFSPARGTINGQDFFGCWRPYGEVVQIQWEDGDIGEIPVRELKPELGA